VQIPEVAGLEPGAAPLQEARTVNPSLIARAQQVFQDRELARARESKVADTTATTGAALAVAEPYKVSDDKRAADAAAAREAAAAARAQAQADKAAALSSKKRTDALRKEYNVESKVPYNALADLDRYTAPVLEGRAAGRKQTPADEFALIYAFNKSLDPTSVVRESEFKNTKGVGAGIEERAYLLLDNWRKGKQLTDAQVTQMLDTIKRARSASVTRLNAIDERYRNLASGMDLDPEQVIRGDYSGGDAPGQEAQWERGPDGKPRRKQ